MMIHKDKCLELGLPEPKSFHNQQTYVLLVISEGHHINTRVARYIGIHNLHSIASILKRKGYNYTHKHGVVKCPFTGSIPPYPVDILSMTPEQISSHKNTKAAQKH